MRDTESANGRAFLCDSSEGGVQGNALTVTAFCATINMAMKGTEAKFDVEIRAMQDDVALVGDPDQIFSEGKALEVLLELLQKVGLEPNKIKFQCPGTTADALDNKPNWLKKKEIDLRDPVTGEVVVDEMGRPSKSTA